MTRDKRKNTEITETVIFVKCCDFAKNAVFCLVFSRSAMILCSLQQFFVFNQDKLKSVGGVILKQKYLILLLLSKSVCCVTYWFNMWTWRCRRNMYFNAEHRQNFTDETL